MDCQRTAPPAETKTKPGSPLKRLRELRAAEMSGRAQNSVMSNLARTSVRYVCCTKWKVPSGCFWIFTPSENFTSPKAFMRKLE